VSVTALNQTGQSGHQQMGLNTSGMSGMSMNTPTTTRPDNTAEDFQTLMATAGQADFHIGPGSSKASASATITKPPS
jgi:hypothetical protein